MNATGRIRELVEANGERWVALRRQLHRHPEVGWTEFVTSATIADSLRHAGVEPILGRPLHGDRRLGVPPGTVLDEAFRRALETGTGSSDLDPMRGGYTGVACVIEGGRPGPLRAFRCDIDALPIVESGDTAHRPAREGFASAIPGVTHACGHDAHTAIGVGLVQVLSALREHLSGSVRVIFQPAEEGVRGAASMVSAGLADGVEEWYGVHVGVNATALGLLMCACDGILATSKLDVEFAGRQAHAAIAPEQGRDALAAACLATVKIKVLARAQPDGRRLHVGMIEGGEGRNIVAAHATLRMETRADDDAALTALRHLVEEILRESDEEFGTTHITRLVGGAPACRFDEAAARRVQTAAGGLDAFTEVRLRDPCFNASDDATAWMDHVQRHGGRAAYIGLGTPTGGGHHTADFDIDERVIPAGVELLSRLFLTGSCT